MIHRNLIKTDVTQLAPSFPYHSTLSTFSFDLVPTLKLLPSSFFNSQKIIKVVL